MILAYAKHKIQKYKIQKQKTKNKRTMEIIRVVQIALIVVNIAIFAWLIYLGRKRKKQIEHCDIGELERLASKAEIADEDCILLILKHGCELGGKYGLIMRGRRKVLTDSLYNILSHDEAEDFVDVLDDATRLLAEECEENDDDEPEDDKEDKKDE